MFTSLKEKEKFKKSFFVGFMKFGSWKEKGQQPVTQDCSAKTAALTVFWESLSNALELPFLWQAT